jgi:hypothetical protein
VADTSNYSTEEHLVVSVWVHEKQFTGQMMNTVMTEFQPTENNKKQNDMASL